MANEKLRFDEVADAGTIDHMHTKRALHSVEQWSAPSVGSLRHISVQCEVCSENGRDTHLFNNWFTVSACLWQSYIQSMQANGDLLFVAWGELILLN